MFRKIVLPLNLITVIVLTACGLATPTPSTDSRLKVVATNSLLGDIVQTVGGDKLELRTLVGANGDAHTFQPSPADGVALVQSALIFENGLGFEPWLDDLYTTSGSKAPRITVTDGVEPIKTEEQGHSEFDPHVWHSVVNVIQMTQNVRDALIAADAAQADFYSANAHAYISQLQDLDTWIMAEVSQLPKDQRQLVTTHDTFSYFAERYGFEIIGAALVSTDSAEPSAEQVAMLVETIKTTRVPAIFVENTTNSKLMEQIANESGVRLAPALYTDAVGEPGSAGDTYLKLMRYNVSTIVAALTR